MNVELERIGAVAVLSLSGRLDFGAAAAFQAEIDSVLAGPGRAAAGGAALGGLILDCAGLDYVSSAGLRVFLVASRGAQRNALPLALCNLKPAVREVFDISGFSRIIAIGADRAAALERMRP